MTADRYAGKPLLRVLELYVLWCIDELKENDKEFLKGFTPLLQQTYHHSGEWFEIIEHVMELPEVAREDIRLFWSRQPSTASPQVFAQSFVDTHLR